MKTKKKPIDVLFVDDCAEMREVTVEALRNAGNIVAEAESAEAALDIMKGFLFSAIITDVYLPGMNGIKLAQIVKKEYPQTGIMLVTGSHEPDVADAAHEIGIDFIIKPFAMSVLIQNLKRVLGKNKGL